MSDLVLTEDELRQGVIDDRRHKLLQKFDLESGQGILPFTSERFFEQSNPIVRSALFTSCKMGGSYGEWTEIFSLGNGSIQYRGPMLTVDHEAVLARIMVLARGRSLTKPVQCFQADIVRWLGLDVSSGLNFKKARAILDDLAAAEIRISSKPALQRLYNLLTQPSLSDMPDGVFFRAYIKNRFNSHLKMIADGLANDQPVDISMRFVETQTHNPSTGRMMLNLDPIAAVFFDGRNTTLLPFDVWESLDRFGKKLLPFIASHRDGVFSIRLEKYFEFSGSKSSYEKVKRRFKFETKKRLAVWEKAGYIESGWDIYRNENNEEIVHGLKLGDVCRIKSTLDILPSNFIDTSFTDGSDELDENDKKLNKLADDLVVPRPSRKKTPATS